MSVLNYDLKIILNTKNQNDKIKFSFELKN